MNDTRTDLPNGDFKFTEIKPHRRFTINTAQLDKDLNDFDMREDVTEFPNNRVIINVEQMHRFWTYANTLKNIRKTHMIEKFEECPKCSAHGKDWNYDGQICALCEKQKEQNQHPLKPLSLTLPPVDLYALVKEVCNEIVGGCPDCYAPTSSIHLQATRVKEAVEYLAARGMIAAKPEPIDGQWQPIEKMGEPQLGKRYWLAAYIVPSEEAARNGSKPFWHVTDGLYVGKTWTGILGGKPSHYMDYITPKPPADI